MRTPRTCRNCGEPLTSDAREGFCPKCLFLEATGAEDRGRKGEDKGQIPILGIDFGDYELLEEIGRGGMGVVYRARQRALDRIVAIKMLAFGPDASPDHIERFRAEAISAAALHHPNIIAIHEVGLHEGRHFFVMDFVEGQSLARIAGDQPLPGRRAAAYLKTIAQAVHYAHEQGILHRDLKPSNVLIDSEDQPQVVDFGLARRVEGDSELTVTGQVLGSPHYLAPEQAAGQRARISRRTDVYGLGATLYHLLTGRPPFQAESLAQTLDLVLHTEPVAPRLLNPSVPRDLETVCLKCLEKEPSRRYPTACALAEELARFQAGEPIQARPLGPAGKAWRWCRRNPALAGTGALAVLAVALGSSGVLWQWHRAKANEWDARRGTYAADMKEAGRALQEGDLGQVQRRLAPYRPGSGLEQLRGFEWRYLAGQSRSDALLTVAARSGQIFSLDLSRDGRTLAAGWRDGWVDLYDAATLRRTAILESNGPYQGTQFSSAPVAFAPAGDLLAAGAGPHIIRLWQVSSGRVLTELPNTNANIAISLSFSPDGKRLAVYYRVDGACIWDLQTRQILWRDPASGAEGDFGAKVAFSPDGRCLAVGDSSGHVWVVDWAANRTVWDVPAHKGHITCLVWSPDGRWLASGSGFQGSAIQLWEPATGKGKPLATLEGHRSYVCALQFSPDGRRLFSASSDQALGTWDVATGRITAFLRGHLAGVSALSLSADGSTLLSGDSAGTLCRWSTEPTRARAGYVHPPGKLWLPVFVDGGTTVAGLDEQGAVLLWDCRAQRPPVVIAALGTNNMNLAAVPSRALIACGNRSGQVQLCWLAQGNQVRSLGGLSDRVVVLGFFRDGRGLVARDRTAQTVVWDTISLSKVAVFQTEGHVVWSNEKLISGAVSPDGRLLVLGLVDGSLASWNLAGGTRLADTPAHRGHVFALAFSSDSRWLASAGDDGTVALWPAEPPRRPIRWTPHNQSCFSLAFSSQGNRFITGHSGNTGLRLWDLATLRDLISLPAEGSLFRHAEWSRDGNAILAAASDGRCYLWRAPSFAELSNTLK